MLRSMYAGVSGLRTHQTMMDVVGNNIANVNTVGFKSSRTIFQDTLSQLIRGASAGVAEGLGGLNPQQVGLGVRLAAIDPVFTQGGSQLTGRNTDVSIQGDGFFTVRFGSEVLYTRAGSFNFDNNGFLIDPSGAVIQGWMADDSGTIETNAPIEDIRLPVGQVIAPIATTSISVSGNLSASAGVGDTPVTTAIQVIDSLGSSHRISIAFAKTADNQWDMTVSDPDGNVLGTESITFDPTTGAVSAPLTAPSYSWTPAGGAAPMTFAVDLGEPGAATSLLQFGSGSTAAAISQDGQTAGYLRAFTIADDGVVSGVFSNGRSTPLARIAVSTFNNPAGLIRTGQSLFRASGASGAAFAGPPGSEGRGTMAAGTLEMSNVDLAAEFTNLIVAQRGFQANSRIITASDELLQDLVNLKR